MKLDENQVCTLLSQHHPKTTIIILSDIKGNHWRGININDNLVHSFFPKMDSQHFPIKLLTQYSIETTSDCSSLCEVSMKAVEDCSAEHTVYPTMFSVSYQTSCKSHEENCADCNRVHSLLKVHQQRQLIFTASEWRVSSPL